MWKKKWFEKSRASASLYIAVCMAVLALVLVVLALWDHGVQAQLLEDEHASEHILELAQQQNYQAAQFFTRAVESAQNVAAAVSAQQRLISYPTFSLLRAVWRSSSIDNYFIAQADTGDFITIFGDKGNCKDRPYFQQALAGEVAISDVITSSLTRAPVYVIAAPVERNGKVIAVLGVTYYKNTLSHILHLDSFAGEGFSLIVGPDGQPVAVPEGRDIEPLLAASGGESLPITRFREQQNEYGSIFIDAAFGGQAYSAYLTPLPHNGWSLLTLVPDHIRGDHIAKVNRLSVVLTLKVSAILAFMLSAVFYSYNSTRRKLLGVYSRYNVALQDMKHIMFEYDIKKDALTFQSGDTMLDMPSFVQDPAAYFYKSGIVDDENRMRLLDILKNIRAGLPRFSTVVQYDNKGRLSFLKISISLMMDGRGGPQYAVGVVEDVTEQVRSDRLLTSRATRDPLTSLHNRGAAIEQINGVLAKMKPGQRHALIMMDIDDFKRINDTRGHKAGDAVLIELAGRMRDAFGPESAGGRLGGDEFVGLFENIEGDADLKHRLEGLSESLSLPIQIGDEKERVSCSIGVACAPKQGMSFSSLYEKADAALYRAKAQGKSRYCLYEDGNTAHLAVQDAAKPASGKPPACLESRELFKLAVARCSSDGEKLLDTAITRRELELFLQPQEAFASGKVSGAEALVRWRHPCYGLMQPDDFIPCLEKNGFVGKLDLYMLQQVCRLLRGQIERGLNALPISVNQSRYTMTRPDYLVNVEDLLREYDLPRGLLTIEMTETFCGDQTVLNAGLLERLRGLGVRLSIDDFGSGYTSLWMLSSVAVDEVKIDQAYTVGLEHSLNDRTVLANLSRMYRELGVDTVVEGVENEAQAKILKDMGFGAGQGYLYAEAMETGDFERSYLSPLPRTGRV